MLKRNLSTNQLAAVIFWHRNALNNYNDLNKTDVKKINFYEIRHCRQVKKYIHS
jgi:hypothetical protein